MGVEVENMYLTDIRGFTAEDNIAVYPTKLSSVHGGEKLLQKADGDILFCAHRSNYPTPLSKITIHGMGILGDEGIMPHFATFCRIYNIEPKHLSISDMGISFFVPTSAKEKVLSALCDFFPMWQ